ncbi:MAG: HEPN domain-containing protein [Deltaproteobacteria bacterium]|nr:HEPN domain-containing protein [Deltaproteobacteria bacterium]
MNYQTRERSGDQDIFTNHWLAKAHQALASAVTNQQHNRMSNAVRDIYFACFSAVTAVFMNEGKIFQKDSALRSAFQREMIKTGRVDPVWGPFLDWVFHNMQQIDYQPMARFEPDLVQELLEKAECFSSDMETLLEVPNSSFQSPESMVISNTGSPTTLTG